MSAKVAIDRMAEARRRGLEGIQVIEYAYGKHWDKNPDIVADFLRYPGGERALKFYRGE